MTCRNCGRELPEEQFEMYATGTRRKVCRHCHYELHTRRAWRKWMMRQRARDSRETQEITRTSCTSCTRRLSAWV